MPSLQILQAPQDPQALMNQQIAGTLGQGLSNFTSHYNANKALEGVLNDPNLKNAPVSDRLDMLTRKLSPYGEVGQGILAARLGIEEQKMKEQQFEQLKQEKLLKQKQNLSIVQALGLDKSLADADPGLLKEIYKIKSENEQFGSFASGNDSNQVSGQTPTLDSRIASGQSPLDSMTDKELTLYVGHKNKRIAEAAKQTLTQRNEAKKADTKEFQADRAYHSKTSDAVVEDSNEILRLAPIRKGLNAQMRRDISSGNISGFFPFMVDKMGLESFRNPETARFSNEIKSKFIQSLVDIPGARPNQFIEKFLSTAQPQIGRSVEANMSVMDLQEFVEDLNDERARKTREIAEKDRKEFGYVKNDVAERADNQLGDYANQRQEKMAYDIRSRHEENLDDTSLLNEIISKSIPADSPVTKRFMRLLMIKNDNNAEKAVKEAQDLKMSFPSRKTYERQ